MTLAQAPLEAEIVYDESDLDADTAAAITGRIRAWVNAFPADDVMQAYAGRIWLTMGYDSWSEWCDCELNGFKLPVLERREVVAELSGSGMSNRAIADVIGVNQKTVGNDLKGREEFSSPDPSRKVTGQDGKSYPAARPKPELPPMPIPMPPKGEPVPLPDPDSPPLPGGPRRRMQRKSSAEVIRRLRDGLTGAAFAIQDYGLDNFESPDMDRTEAQEIVKEIRNSIAQFNKIKNILEGIA